MIGAATMGAVLSATTAASDTTCFATPAAGDPSSQSTHAMSTEAPSTRSANSASHGQTPSRTQSAGDDASEFDRLLEPDAMPATAAADASAKPAATEDTRPTAVSTSGTQDPSLADRLLGLLGLLGTPAAATPPAAANTANPAAPTASAPTRPAAAAASPLRALAQGASAADSPITVAAPATDTAQASPGTPTTADFIVERATRDASVPGGSDLATMATRDPPSLSAPTPLPMRVDKLASVPQPALAHPANPDAGYGDDLGSSVVWMAEQRVGHAALQVSPDHLGPIEVRLQLDGARVHAEFFSAQPEVRHALEASLPRLRDLLGQQGLQLGHADVGQRQRHDTPRAQPSGNGQDDCFPDDARPLPTTLRRARGLVDEYA